MAREENQGVGVTTENAIKHLKFLRKIFCDGYMKNIPKNSISYQATLKEKEFYDMAIKSLETMEEFERAQILVGGRLNGRAYAYKCGLEDGKRKALEKEQPTLNKIRSEIERQDKWLAQAGYNAYNVDIAFHSIKLALARTES